MDLSKLVTIVEILYLTTILYANIYMVIILILGVTASPFICYYIVKILVQSNIFVRDGFIMGQIKFSIIWTLKKFYKVDLPISITIMDIILELNSKIQNDTSIDFPKEHCKIFIRMANLFKKEENEYTNTNTNSKLDFSIDKLKKN